MTLSLYIFSSDKDNLYYIILYKIMSYISGTQTIIYFAGLALVLFLLGCAGTNFLTFNTGVKGYDPNFNPYVIENLEVPEVASTGEVSSGSSELYGWGYKPIQKNQNQQLKHNLEIVLVVRMCLLITQMYVFNVTMTQKTVVMQILHKMLILTNMF